MFRITRGMTTQHGPAFSPIFRFPDGELLPIVGDEGAGDALPSARDEASAVTPSAAPQRADGDAAAPDAGTGAELS
jgi:hypothetical protein